MHVRGLLLLAFCVGVFATTYNINPGDSFISTLQNLAAGDVVNFQTGTHTLSSRCGFTLPGTPSNPITIQGVGSVIITRDASENIWDFSGSNFIIRNIEFVGGSKGLRMGDGNDVSNALFEDIKIHGTAATAWSFNDDGTDYNNITARRVEIYDTGSDTSECIYPGCNLGGCTFRNSIFEYIYCHDTLSAEDGYGSGINLKSGSYNNIVRHSVFWNTKGPGVFFYDSYDLGDNIAYGNLIVNGADNGIQVTAGCVIENNIVINSGVAGIAGTTNQVMDNSVPRNIKILGNTVIGSATDVCLRGNSWGDSSITVANNAFFCEDAPGGAFKINGDQSSATWANNGYIGGDAPSGAESGVFVISDEATELVDPTNYNYYPQSTSHLLNAGSASLLTSEDFNCNPRSSSAPTVGAYQYSSASNPGWAITQAMKPACGSSSGTTSSASGSTTGSSSTTGATGISSSVYLTWTVSDESLLLQANLADALANLMSIDVSRVSVDRVCATYGDSTTATAVFRVKDDGADSGQSHTDAFIELITSGDSSVTSAGFASATASYTAPTGGSANSDDQSSGVEKWTPAFVALLPAVAMLF